MLEKVINSVGKGLAGLGLVFTSSCGPLSTTTIYTPRHYSPQQNADQIIDYYLKKGCNKGYSLNSYGFECSREIYKDNVPYAVMSKSQVVHIKIFWKEIEEVHSFCLGGLFDICDIHFKLKGRQYITELYQFLNSKDADKFVNAVMTKVSL